MRRDGNLNELKKVPGPGRYTTQAEDRQISSARCTFGNKQKDYELLYKKDFPPPNAYKPFHINSQ